MSEQGEEMSLPALISDYRSADKPLEELLAHSERYGVITLAKMSGGWMAWIKMNTNTTGTTFEVKSESSHKTSHAAAAQCIDRMHSALKVLG